MLTIPNIKKATNLDLARTALNCLEELVRRGNERLDKARQDVAFFYSDVLSLQSRKSALEANELDAEQLDYELDYEDKIALDD